MVTINRNGLSKAKFTEIIEINSHVGQDIIKDSVGVYLNGIFDERDSTYYGIVKIGSQTWLSENLKIGSTIYVYNSPADSSRNDGTVDKYCYDNLLSNCDVYGGFYQWVEMMQYNPPDTGLIGTTQGICMDGWHLPTFKEWETLFYFLGGHKEAGMAGYFDVGDKLKESGSTHWKVPNSGATNESGFTAIPGGNLTANSEADWSQNHWTFKGAGSGGYWMSASRNLGIQIMHSTDNHVADVINWIPMQIAAGNKPYAGSVRCIKNPSKNR